MKTRGTGEEESQALVSLPHHPKYFIFAHFYPTCRHTSRVEGAACFITEVLGDGRGRPDSRTDLKKSANLWNRSKK